VLAAASQALATSFPARALVVADAYLSLWTLRPCVAAFSNWRACR